MALRGAPDVLDAHPVRYQEPSIAPLDNLAGELGISRPALLQDGYVAASAFGIGGLTRERLRAASRPIENNAAETMRKA